ncbi:MAG: hypothetical protein IJT04_01835 [Bacteroidales bacterium]|nr:hypothetical protein [Bacteroidales bacterium]
MKNPLLFFLLLLICFPLFSQEIAQEELSEILLEGTYTGHNIYILNPNQDDRFCVQKVVLNGKSYAFANHSNAFEINLSGFMPNDFIVIQIFHTPNCTPTIINRDKLKKVTEFSLPSFVYNKKTKMLTWDASELTDHYEYDLEQLLYGKWIKIKYLGTTSDMFANNYLPVLLSGMNYFRIKQVDNQGKELYSTIVNVKSPNQHIMLITDKVKDAVEFTDVTHYELYDENGFFIKRGTAKKINVADLNKGIYWLNFDGNEIRITKK